MNKIRISLLLVIAGLGLMTLSGCGSCMDPSQSQLPWARPAPWQSSSPGVAF